MATVHPNVVPSANDVIAPLNAEVKQTFLDHGGYNGESNWNKRPPDPPESPGPVEELRVAMDEAVQTGNLDKVRNLLRFVDPNEMFDYKKGLQFHGCPLTYAVKLEHRGLVEALLEAQADPNSTYSFKCGATQVRNCAPAACAAIAKKRPALFRLLHQSKANLEGRVLSFDGEPNATLLYEACYLGCLPIIKYLQKYTNAFKQDLHTEVRHQDDLNRLMCPLHVAAWRGHCDVVEELLKHGAVIKPNCITESQLRKSAQKLQDKYDSRSFVGNAVHMVTASDMVQPDIERYKSLGKIVSEAELRDLKHGEEKYGRGPPALADAIDMGNVDIVRMLIKEGADIFEGPPFYRGIDFILNTHNLIIIAAVAAGLRATTSYDMIRMTEKKPWGMSGDDLVEFMMTPNCEEIYDAIFQKQTVQDWKGRIRFELLNAQVPDRSIQINISEGPAHEELTRLFDKRKSLEAEEQEKILTSIYNDDPHIQQFIDKLLPGRAELSRGIQPIEIRQCVLPDVHNNPKVAHALASGVHSTAFEHPGYRALVMHRWQQAKPWYKTNFVCNLLLAILFLVASFFINNKAKPTERIILASVALLLWLRGIFYELMQMIGLAMLGCFQDTYAKDFGNILDIIRISLTGFGIIMLYNADNFNVANNMKIRISLSVVMFLLWLKVLYCQRGFDSIGTYMLPILTAVSSTWNFLGVMIWPAVGFAQMYFMLDVYPEFFRAATLVYRMGFVGDFDIEEVEDIDPEFTPNDDWPGGEGAALEVDDPKWTPYHVVFVIFTVVVTLAFAIIMMNILIGVLSEAYNTAYSNRHRLFLQSRAVIGFEHLAVQTTFDRFFGSFRRKNMLGTEKQETFLWYSRPKNMEELGLPDEDDDDNANNADNTHDLIKMVMNEVHELKEFIKAKTLEEEVDQSLEHIHKNQIQRIASTAK